MAGGARIDVSLSSRSAAIRLECPNTKAFKLFDVVNGY
jgi:hypothetical protein